MKYLNLIRYKNLLLLAFMQLVFRYGFLKLQNVALAFSDWQYFLFVLATVCIAAGGYVINDIFDQDTDNENKPETVIVGKHLSENKAYNLYTALTFVGVSLGFYLSNVIGKPSFATLYILIAATLYLYATSLKKIILVGNGIIALLLASSVIMVGVFDLLPANYLYNKQVMILLFSILIDYALFTFILNFIRELVKSLEDVKGDDNQGRNTLPIAIGVERTTKIVFVLSFIPIVCVLYYLKVYLFNNNLLISTIYGLIFIACPLLYFTVKIWSAKKTADFRHLSMILKWILFFGIISIVVISLNMKK